MKARRSTGGGKISIKGNLALKRLSINRPGQGISTFAD